MLSNPLCKHLSTPDRQGRNRWSPGTQHLVQTGHGNAKGVARARRCVTYQGTVTVLLRTNEACLDTSSHLEKKQFRASIFGSAAGAPQGDLNHLPLRLHQRMSVSISVSFALIAAAVGLSPGLME